MDDEDILLRSFIGEKYDKFKDKKFFIPAFLFGGLYYIYRKIYGLGIILYVVTMFVTLWLSQIISNIFLILLLHILISVVYGISFGTIYIKFSNKKVNNIRKQKSKNEENLLKICESKGRTSFLGVVIIIILFAILPNNIISRFENNSMSLTSEYDLETKISDKASEYNGGMSINTKINLDKTIKIQIPTIFSESLTNEVYNYEYEYDTNGEGVFDTCRMLLGVVNGYTDSNKLINEMAKYHSAIDTLETKKINNIEWVTYVYVNEIGTDYISSTTHNGLVYIFEYSIGRDVRGSATEYIKYYNSILNSIIFID